MYSSKKVSKSSTVKKRSGYVITSPVPCKAKNVTEARKKKKKKKEEEEKEEEKEEETQVQGIKSRSHNHYIFTL